MNVVEILEVELFNAYLIAHEPHMRSMCVRTYVYVCMLHVCVYLCMCFMPERVYSCSIYVVAWSQSRALTAEFPQLPGLSQEAPGYSSPPQRAAAGKFARRQRQARLDHPSPNLQAFVRCRAV